MGNMGRHLYLGISALKRDTRPDLFFAYIPHIVGTSH